MKISRSGKRSFPIWEMTFFFVAGFFAFLLFSMFDGISSMKDYGLHVNYEQAAAVSESAAISPVEAPKFREVAQKTGTDKVQGHIRLPPCIEDPKMCIHPDYDNQKCRPFGHFYDTIYDRWLGPYATGNIPMQFLEIGYFRGAGFEAFTHYLSNNKAAELHSLEISCIEKGPQKEGKWPWDNFGEKHPWYQRLRDENRLHCGDASKYDVLLDTWTNKMKRPDAPPLKVVIDDAAHIAAHMATSLFFWFPRIEPGGILIMEDIQPSNAADDFRLKILPQVMKDIHWCGGKPSAENTIKSDSVCFPQIQRLLQGVHCELHVCVFVRNDEPASEPDKEGSTTPKDAFNDDKIKKCLFGPH